MDKKFIILFLFIIIQSSYGFKNLNTLFVNNIHRICFRIGTSTAIRAGCINCLQQRLPETLNKCLNQATIPESITDAQANCLIKECSAQIPGQQQLLTQQTRRRRSINFKIN